MAEPANLGGEATFSDSPAAFASRGFASAGALLHLLRATGGMTRQELIEATGLSRTTVVQRVGDLERVGLVRQAGRRSPTGGRPARALCFDEGNRMVLTLDAGQTRATVSVCTPDARPLESVTLGLPPSPTAASLVSHLSEAALPLVARHPDLALIGVGMGVPAPVRDVRGGDRWPTAAMPDAQHHVAADLEARFGVPAVVENDARAMALGDHPGSRDGVFMSIKYANGIGAGMIADGHILRGSTGAAGDVGHIRVDDSGPLCTCGGHGCLAAYTSGRALVRSLAHRGCRSLPDVIALLDADDEEVIALVGAAASRLGVHVASLIQALNPRRVALGGSLGLHPFVRARLTQAILQHILPRVAQHVDIVPSPLGHLAGTAGLARLVVDTVYAPDRVDALIEATARPAS